MVWAVGSVENMSGETLVITADDEPLDDACDMARGGMSRLTAAVSCGCLSSLCLHSAIVG